MIKDIFEQVQQSIGKCLYVDDGAFWIRGRNLEYRVVVEVQAAIEIVEQWSNKSEVICCSRCHKSLSLKRYSQTLEQVRVVGVIGVLFDEKLTWREHTDKVTDQV